MTIAVEKPAENLAEKPGEKRKALGRGLDSLLPGPRTISAAVVVPVGDTASRSAGRPAAPPSPQPAGDHVEQIDLDRIDANPYQTRRFFSDEPLHELAESIKANGVMQPVVVRPLADGRYKLILGERRCRAAKLAGLKTIAAIVRTVSDQQAAEMTVIENLQRQDLTCWEQANAFARLSQDFHLTQEQIGQRTGCARESVSNYLRLLRLPAPVQAFLRDRQMGFSEAKVLLQLGDVELIVPFAEQAVKKQLSLGQLRQMVEDANTLVPDEKKKPGARWQDPNVREAQTRLERALGVRVRISDRKGKGKITIEYSSLEDFDRVLEMLKAN